MDHGTMVEHEICANCKKEIPHFNYVMHTAHCARNLTLCSYCKEPISKPLYEEHKKCCQSKLKKTPPPPLPLPTATPSLVHNGLKSVEQRHLSQHRLVDSGQSITKSTRLKACKYCELELTDGDMIDHENYCGSRTDRCLDCGEFVMFKYKQLHIDSNHGFLKLNDEPGPKPSWDSTTQRSRSDVALASLSTPRPSFRPTPLRPFIDTTSYAFPSNYNGGGAIGGAAKPEKSESYKEISRRLDCKTEYIRNLLHDSASITVPLRSNGAMPRNHFNHNKGPAPQPPRHRRNPPTELTIPCEFCQTPIPHVDLIEHESSCRPVLNGRRGSGRRGATYNPADFDDDDDYWTAAQMAPSSPEVELPCEFCADLIPASQLLRHQATCN